MGMLRFPCHRHNSKHFQYRLWNGVSADRGVGRFILPVPRVPFAAAQQISQPLIRPFVLGLTFCNSNRSATRSAPAAPRFAAASDQTDAGAHAFICYLSSHRLETRLERLMDLKELRSILAGRIVVASHYV